MAGTMARRGRHRGRIEQLPSGLVRASVYTGIDPVTKKRHYLREVIPAGPTARRDAERALRRLASQVDEQAQAKTSATVDQLLDLQHFELLEVEPTTLATYETLARGHIRPLSGKQKVSALHARMFDSFYAEFRRCRLHCDRRDRSRLFADLIPSTCWFNNVAIRRRASTDGHTVSPTTSA